MRPRSPRREFAFLINDVARLLRTLADQRARQFGMTRAQWAVLARLESNEGLKQSELAEMLGVDVDDQGNIVVGLHCDTPLPGLFAAGDVVVGLDQLAVATGHGAIAATAMHNYLRSKE